MDLIIPWKPTILETYDFNSKSILWHMFLKPIGD